MISLEFVCQNAYYYYRSHGTLHSTVDCVDSNERHTHFVWWLFTSHLLRSNRFRLILSCFLRLGNVSFYFSISTYLSHWVNRCVRIDVWMCDGPAVRIFPIEWFCASARFVTPSTQMNAPRRSMYFHFELHCCCWFHPSSGHHLTNNEYKTNFLKLAFLSQMFCFFSALKSPYTIFNG